MSQRLRSNLWSAGDPPAWHARCEGSARWNVTLLSSYWWCTASPISGWGLPIVHICLFTSCSIQSMLMMVAFSLQTIKRPLHATVGWEKRFFSSSCFPRSSKKRLTNLVHALSPSMQQAKLSLHGMESRWPMHVQLSLCMIPHRRPLWASSWNPMEYVLTFQMMMSMVTLLHTTQNLVFKSDSLG